MPITDLDPRLLRSFCTVAEELHFRRAATRLNTTQSAVSAQIAELERRIGVILLERDRRRVTLTEAGRSILADARSLLQQAEQAAARARAIARGQQGGLTLGLIGAASFQALPALMQRLRRQVPDLHCRFIEMTGAEQVQALRQGRIDAGLVRAEPDLPGLSAMTLWREGVLCLLPAAHPLTAKPQIAIRDLQHEPILNLSREADPAGHDFYLSLYRAAGFEPEIRQEVSQIATILFVIAETGCVALGPEGWTVLRREGVVLRPLAPPVPQVPTRLIWNPARESRALQQLLRAAGSLAGG